MKSFSIVVFVLMVAACSKPPIYVRPQKNYQYFETFFLTHFQPVRLFTNNGEITDPALVKRYSNVFSQYLFNSHDSFIDPRFKSFTWVSDDSLLNSAQAPILELKRVETGVYDKYAGKFTVPVNDTNALFLHLGQYPMHRLATTSQGYTYAEYESPSSILKKVNDTLFLPTVNYIVMSRYNYTYSFSNDKINNVFNPAGAGKLGSNDTMLVQTFDVGLKKTN